MARYPVDYTLRDVIPSPAFPARTKAPRPIVPVILANANLWCPCYAIVDSGADDCVFPASFGMQIGLDYRNGAYYEFGGAGADNQPAGFFNITLSIGTVITYQALIGFTPGLEGFGVGLLGQHGFFDRFKLEFDLRNTVFYIEE